MKVDWVQRWDAQQERYVPDREERFRVVADVVGWASRSRGGSHGPARVVDLGCGPGSLGTRLAASLPGTEVVGIDADPLLLGLAEGRLRTVRGDLTDPGWPELLDLPGPWDAAVSSTALHWLAPRDLAALYRTLAARLRPGGVFVDADHRAIGGIADLARHVRTARAERAGVTANEDWTTWWDGVQADPDLGPLVDIRSAGTIAHSAENELTLDEQVALLRDAGFAAAAPVWQWGDDVVLVAVR